MVISCCWYFELVYVLVDIFPGQDVAKDIIAFLHVKNFDCCFRPALNVTRRCSCSLGGSCWLDDISQLGEEESEVLVDLRLGRAVVQK
jgi:hypothetical protein